jgi:molecular chaperone Hsp33
VKNLNNQLSEQKDNDQVRRFLFERNPIRGQHVSLDASWRKIVAQSGAEGTALTLLGHALAAVTLLVDTLKINGSVSLQIRGKGAIHLLVAEATSNNTIRGLVRQSHELGEQKSLQDIFASDKLVITIKNGTGKPHQGIVPLDGDSLSVALQSYFDQSEQLPTRFWFACDENAATGMLLQTLPAEVVDDDTWNRLLHLASTTTGQELLDLKAEELLHRLYHEEDLRLFEADTIRFACGCSKQRTRNMLISLGRTEVDDIIRERSEIAITCEFCNARYAFDSVDVEQLLLDKEYATPGLTRH